MHYYLAVAIARKKFELKIPGGSRDIYTELFANENLRGFTNMN